jgi:hypothetical protein
MTSSGDTGPEELASQPLAAAEADLAQIRERLEAVARGEAGAEELTASVKGYLDEHGTTLQDAAAAVGEEARRQTLEELYKWRAQLNAQLEARKRTT